MTDYHALENTQLVFNQNKSKNLDNFKYMQELRYRDSLDLLSQTQQIAFLEKKVKSLSKFQHNQIPFDNISKEVKINYSSIEQFSYAIEIKTNFIKTDTISIFEVKWNKSAENKVEISKEKEKLEMWLKQRLGLDTLVVKQSN